MKYLILNCSIFLIQKFSMLILCVKNSTKKVLKSLFFLKNLNVNDPE
jgi:hypothetical protein